MQLSDEGIKNIGQWADENKDVKLMFLVLILQELRGIRTLLEEKQKPGDGGNDGTQGTN